MPKQFTILKSVDMEALEEMLTKELENTTAADREKVKRLSLARSMIRLRFVPSGCFDWIP